MRQHISENRTVWLLVGVILGLGIAGFWPRERAYAVTSDRADKFIMTTCTVSVIGMDPIEAVFVLDMSTGHLRGAALSRQQAKFCTFYYRNVAADFGVDAKAESQFAFVNGQAQLLARGGVTWASSVLYVGEYNSGKVICYAFPWREAQGKMDAVELTVVDSWPLRSR